MKKILLFIISLPFFFCSTAKTLKIYSVTGTVTKKDGTSWTRLTKPGTLSDSETININPASSLRVLDTDSRQVYTFSQEGKHLVSALLKQAAQENRSLSGKIAAESRRQSTLAAKKVHQDVGAAKRATLDEEQQEALYSALVKGFALGVNQGDLILDKHKAEDELIYLSISNIGNIPLYVNVFTTKSDGHWGAVYQFDNENPALIIAPGKSVLMDNLLLSDEENVPFVAVGYFEAFDGAELTDMFSEDFEPEENSADGVSLYFNK